MSRIEKTFKLLEENASKALVPYITAGDPDPVLTVKMMHALVDAGADILELGVPFSDPMADGPVIQRASERALAHKVSLTNVLAMVSEFREKNTQTPVILMGYLNPIEVMGYELFAETAVKAGVDGIITVDMPPEEAEDYLAALYKHQLAPIFLIAPTSTDQRISTICAAGRGFIYYVSFKGITGASHLDVGSVEKSLARIRALTALPVAVGFGIKDASSAADISTIADAVVVGSAVIRKIEDCCVDGKVNEQNMLVSITELVSEMKKAINEKLSLSA